MESEWEYYYLDVDKINKYIIPIIDSIKEEIEKLNQFVKLISNYIKVKEQNKLSQFILYNYNCLHQILTSYDKQFNTSYFEIIFNNIHNQYFYSYYLKLPKPRQSTKLIIFYNYNNLITNSTDEKSLQIMFHKLKSYHIKTFIHDNKTLIINQIKKLCIKFKINPSNITFVCSDNIGIHIAHNLSCGYIIGIEKEKQLEILQYANIVTDNIINILNILNILN